jgi:Concanavalin A-like lectin/glucanases superfamily/PGAP1-like protein
MKKHLYFFVFLLLSLCATAQTTVPVDTVYEDYNWGQIFTLNTHHYYLNQARYCPNSDSSITIWASPSFNFTWRIAPWDVCSYAGRSSIDGVDAPLWTGEGIITTYLSNKYPDNNNPIIVDNSGIPLACLAVAKVRPTTTTTYRCTIKEKQFFPQSCGRAKLKIITIRYQITVYVPSLVTNSAFIRPQGSPQQYQTLSITEGTTVDFVSSVSSNTGSYIFELENTTNNLTELSTLNWNPIISRQVVDNTKFRSKSGVPISSNPDRYCYGDWSPPMYVSVIKPKTLHYHQFTNSTNRRLLDSTNVIKVCADGANNSILKFSRNGLNYSQYGVRIKQDPTTINSKVYGSISILNRNDDSLVIRYTHPVLVNSTSLYSEHDIEVFNTTSPNTVVGTYKIQVYRPPVLMVHGLGSDASSFFTMRQSLLNQYIPSLLRNANYNLTNKQPFLRNQDVVPTNIYQLIENGLENKISVSKVSVIGHSMGGILARLFLQSNQYDNSIFKLITINTPHSGSQLGDFANEPLVQNLCDKFLMDCSLAVSDLSVEGNSIRSLINGVALNRSTAPSHTITTTFATTLLQVNSQLQKLPLSIVRSNFIMKAVFGVSNAVNGYNNIFNSEPHDLAVPISSQKGGLTGNCTTTNINNQWHIGSQSNGDVINKVKLLLEADPNSNNFCLGFSPPTLEYNPINNLVVSNPKKITNIVSTTNPTIEIVTPSKNISVNLGSEIAIKIEGQNLSNFDIFVEYNQDSIFVANFSVIPETLKIPITSYFKKGICNILVVGYDSNGNSVSGSSTFVVNDCQNSTINVTSLDKDFYQSSEAINLSSIVPSNVNLILKSEKNVNLTTGFTSDTPTIISASIEPCNTNTELVCHYPFNGNANDESGNNFNGTVTGASLTTDRFGQSNKAMLFDGNDKITVPNFNQVTGNSPRTISLWVKTTQTNEHNYWIYWGAYSDNASCVVGNIFDPPPTNRFGLLGWANDTYITNSTHFDNNWHQVVVTHDGQITKLFIDGVLKTQRTLTRPYQTGVDKLTIGCSIADHAYFKGTLDDIKIFKRCLSDEEVIQQYYLEKP